MERDDFGDVHRWEDNTKIDCEIINYAEVA
jgi:hypothetical protein